MEDPIRIHLHRDGHAYRRDDGGRWEGCVCNADGTCSWDEDEQAGLVADFDIEAEERNAIVALLDSVAQEVPYLRRHGPVKMRRPEGPQGWTVEVWDSPERFFDELDYLRSVYAAAARFHTSVTIQRKGGASKPRMPYEAYEDLDAVFEARAKAEAERWAKIRAAEEGDEEPIDIAELAPDDEPAGAPEVATE